MYHILKQAPWAPELANTRAIEDIVIIIAKNQQIHINMQSLSIFNYYSYAKNLYCLFKIGKKKRGK